MTPITIENLSKRFGATVAVDGVDLRIEAGELFFLLGPSGCGKTTLMRMVAGLVEPTAGRIFFGGKEVTVLPTGQRGTAMVFQGYALWPHMTVAQNVGFGLEVRKVGAADRKRQVEEALGAVRMEQYAQRRPAELSGGQQQRVALARALAVNPQVLLLDEPLSNLDAKLRQQMRGEIRRLCTQAGITGVYVTHDQTEALAMADRMAVMREGKLCQVGSPREVYERPGSRFVADFLGATNFLAATVVGRGDGQVLLESEAGRLRSAVFPDQVREGDAVTCSVRPETLQLLEAGQATENEVSGEITETVYLGHVAQHQVCVREGVGMRVEELKPGPGGLGKRVRIGFGAGDVVVLTD